MNMVAQAGQKLPVQIPLGGRPPSIASNAGRLNSRGAKHWPLPANDCDFMSVQLEV
jgi:hypothetical protein